MNIASIKYVLYFKDGEFRLEKAEQQFLPIDLGDNPGTLKTDHGFTFESPKHGRYQINGQLEFGLNRDTDGKLTEIVLNSAQIQSAVGYLFGQVSGQYDFIKKNGSLTANLGQDLGYGTGVGVAASAWLVLPIVE